MAVNNYIKWPAERIRQDKNNRLVTDLQITTWNGKADSDHNHDDKYIPLTGTTALTGDIVPNKSICLGTVNHPFSNINCRDLMCVDSNANIKVQIGGNGIVFKSADNSEKYGTINVGLLTNTFIAWTLPDKSGTFALDTDIPTIPESLKNPNALSIQLNGGDANTYDGSAALNIDITPAAIGAATSGDLANYIPMTGTATPSVNIYPSETNIYSLGSSQYQFAQVSSRNFYSSNSDGELNIEMNGIERAILFYNNDSSIEGQKPFAKLFANKISGNWGWALPDKSGTIAMTNDIPKSLPASDVKDWAKADAKPTYTFAEITEKPEKFTPDTHTHTITEVTDLQTTLDDKAAKNHVHDSEKVTNWNNAVVSGVYYAEADAVNNPSADAAYSGNVVKGSTIVTQTVVKETIDGDLYKYIRRGQLDTNRTTVTTWGQWQEIQYVVTE